MVPRVSREPLAPRGLFLLQLCLGAVAGLGAVACWWAADGPGGGAPVAVVALVTWLGLCTAAVVALERRKPLAVPPRDPAEWARHVGDLRSSRLEIVNAFEIERRRIERDLHDGSQQHIVASSLKIGEAALLLSTVVAPPREVRQVTELLAEAQDATDAALAALRATVAGIHPKVLSDVGLDAAVRDLARRSGLPAVVRVPHPLPPVPQGVAAAAYFFVSEALTNVAKHAPGARVTVLLSADDTLHVSVVDDGPGGARVRPGHGLAGMSERLAAFGGGLQVASPAGGPTSLVARVPLLLPEGEPGVTGAGSPTWQQVGR
ncbi:sensor histidine kinase [Auraticoccus monumenti]|uniref:histidine kinase n=1 Tax=Auraticoccus monumenti TaxID=675864 RepID=A0A1G7A6V2_9ACTN|nr:histidine kinase [Auraticoccus monumenti]SDE10542.1 Histidine kinase [Auraticoccus monumenti]